MKRSLLVFGLLLLNGCSFVFVDGPPSPALQQALRERNQTEPCTTSMSWPLADAAWTGLMASAAFFGGEPSGELVDGRIFAGIWGAITGVSAVEGFRRVAACSDYLEGESAPFSPSPSPGLSFPSAPSPLLVGWHTVSDSRLGNVDKRLDLQHRLAIWQFREEFRGFSGVREGNQR